MEEEVEVDVEVEVEVEVEVGVGVGVETKMEIGESGIDDRSSSLYVVRGRLKI